MIKMFGGEIMEKIYKPKDVANLLGVTVNTLQRWDREGKFKAYRNAANRRYYTQEQLNKFLGMKNTRENVIYARVSSAGQKDDLNSQYHFLIQYANANGIKIDRHIKEIGSGLNYKRKQWNKLLEDVEDRKINQIFVTYKDRFVRFGFDWFDQFCRRHGTEIVVINNPETSPMQEMITDLVSIIHVFSCRMYGLRRYSKEIKRDFAKNQKGSE